jgi:Na+-driven multidrug efflux pump
MNWRKFFLTSALTIGMLPFCPWLFDAIMPHPLHAHQHSLASSYLFVFAPGAVIALLCLAGMQLLRQGHHAQAIQGYSVIMCILIIPLLTRTVTGAGASTVLYAVFAVGASVLPIALFLDRRQRGGERLN